MQPQARGRRYRRTGSASRQALTSADLMRYVKRVSRNSQPLDIHLIGDRGRDWVQIIATALPGLAAMIALIFAFYSLQSTNTSLVLSEQAQQADRLNTAVGDLASTNSETQLEGVYALEELMRTDQQAQPTIVELLCAYIRDVASLNTTSKTSGMTSNPQPSAQVQAALTALVTRNQSFDDGAIINLNHADVYAVLTSKMQS